MSNNYAALKPHRAPQKTDLSIESIGLNHRPLTEAVTFYKTNSSAFDINTSVNPLIAAAAPVLMAITTLKKQPMREDPTNLHQPLVHEIKIFEEKARKLEYRSAIILAARYFLCSFLDEVLAIDNENSQSVWHCHPLLQTVHGETWGGERFYMILERASNDAASHIDLLELGFLCLSLGYQGKYQKAENPVRELENIKDNLLMRITKIRGNPPVPLLMKDPATKPIAFASKQPSLPHVIIATGLLLVGTLLVYLPYDIHLTHVTKPLSGLVLTHD